MATTTVNHHAHSGSVNTEKIVYKGYAKLDEKGQVDKVQAKAESANQASWKAMETEAKKKEWSEFNQNEFLRYSIKDEAGFHVLVPDAAQRTYIIQSGLNYIQNAKINGYMVDVHEDGITPKYNQETIDLREAINTPPERRSLTDMEKLERLLAQMNVDPATKEAMLIEAAKRNAAKAAASQSAPEQYEEVAQ